jgi:Ran-binding protein 9/10
MRAEIRAAILDGDIDKALKHTNAYYPTVLQENEDIYFKLRCRKFIEMIRRCNELSTANNSATPVTNASHSSKRNASISIQNCNSTATDDYDFEMELDEQLGVHNGVPWNSANDKSLDEENAVKSDRNARASDLTQEMIEYGIELQAEFAGDARREVKRALEDTFALVAYENVGSSSLAPLLEIGGRVPVAEELNGAILGTSQFSLVGLQFFQYSPLCS